MRQKKLILSIIAAMILFAGCAPSFEEADDSLATPDKILQVAQGNNGFAFDLYRIYKEKDGNLFYSPYSIYANMAIAYEGAAGTTASEMAEVFKFPADDTRRPGFAALYNSLNRKNEEYMLSTANALWAQENYGFLPEYLEISKNYYGGNVKNLNFGEPEPARLEINKWVEENTNQKIKDLLPAGSIDSMTRLVITNAIHFKGSWVTPFIKDKTADRDFFIAKDNKVTAKMMSVGKAKEFKYMKEKGYQAIELPYKGEKVSMLILLPELGTIEEFEDSLDEGVLESVDSKLQSQKVSVMVPKFKFNTKYFMSQDLQQMGMKQAFTSGADFSGMTGTKDLYISFVIHQAFIDVYEEGTEAAAATGTGIGTTSMPIQEYFIADHPFIFMITDEETGLILFLGRLSNPCKG
ncbi:MAG: serpin family protein [Nanoarchaeota archaeon]|nr:serpin family protein [Nanoarchaeota archaeon]